MKIYTNGRISNVILGAIKKQMKYIISFYIAYKQKLERADQAQV